MKKFKINTKMHFLFASTVIIALIFAFSSSAHAFKMTLTDGSTTVTELDLDGNGLIMYNDDIGVFAVNVTTGVTKPMIGDTNHPSIDLNSLNVTSGGASTLTIILSESGYGPMDSCLSNFYTMIGGNTDSIVNFDAYYDITNTEWTTIPIGATQIADLGPFSPTATGGDIDGVANYSGFDPSYNPFSLTLVATITSTGAGQLTSFDGRTTATPEPGTILLLGFGLLGLGIISKRKPEVKG